MCVCVCVCVCVCARVCVCVITVKKTMNQTSNIHSRFVNQCFDQNS